MPLSSNKEMIVNMILMFKLDELMLRFNVRFCGSHPYIF